jgi:alpha-tubulin suppressor-like RCC1 family protein
VCWGRNHVGQLGRGASSADPRNAAGSVTGLTSGIVGLASGANHACALRQNGKVACWGAGSRGQTGAPDAPLEVPAPVDVVGIDGAKEIAAGDDFTCARIGGALKCWGDGRRGQLAVGTLTNPDPCKGDNVSACAYAPRAVPGIDDVTAIAAGGSTLCVVRSGGVVWCAGDDAEGQLGRGEVDGGTSADELKPTTLGVVGAVRVGARHACALQQGTKTLYCWGSNARGALFDAAVPRRFVPTPVPLGTITGSTGVAAGLDFTCVERDGSVLCAGSNEFGTVGITPPSTQPFSAPNRVPGLP